MIKNLLNKYHEIIMYIIMGVGTTMVSLASYYILANGVHINYQISNIISWILAVTFAYVTNKKYVFESHVSDSKSIIKEASSFYIARLSTLLIEMISMFIFVTLLQYDANIIKLLNHVIVFVLNYIFSKLFVFNEVKMNNKCNVPFISLAPTDEADKNGVYAEALEWAIKSENVYNVALTGVYGSGKSSIIKSFFKNHKNYHHIDISLATLNNNKSEDEDQLPNQVNEQSNGKVNSESMIEQSILQQLFYSVPANKIPFSRFKRIEVISKLKLIWFIALFMIITNVIIAFNNYSTVVKIIENYYSNKNMMSIIILIYVVFNVSIVYLLYDLSYYLLTHMKLGKFIFKSEYIQIESDDESIINKYIDDIIYFFKATYYKIIVFEDLDRFDDYTNIFIKLKDLNRLLNQNKDEKDKVTFIYAVKDDLFINESDKVKFFDFVIPVVAIDSNISIFTDLKKMLKDYGFESMLFRDYEDYDDYKIYEYNNFFLKDMCKYITDRRSLTNIMNEFYIYVHNFPTLESASFYQHIFALIIYKNHDPKEYHNLILGKGAIDYILNCKVEMVDNESKKLLSRKLKLEFDKSSTDYTKEIKMLENQLSELAYMTMAEYIETSSNFDRQCIGELEYVFIKNKYIDESYIFYLSYFEKCILSNNDLAFYLYVKGNEETDLSYCTMPLTSIVYLITMFSKDDFKSMHICNYSLLIYLFEHKDRYGIQLNDLITSLFTNNHLFYDSTMSRIILEKLKDEKLFQSIVNYVLKYFDKSDDLKEFKKIIALFTKSIAVY